MARGVMAGAVGGAPPPPCELDALADGALFEPLERALAEACRAVGGGELAAAASRKRSLLRRRGDEDGPDWEWRGARAAFMCLASMQRRLHERGAVRGAEPPPPGVLCTAVSEFGTRREKRFGSADELASAIVDQLSDAVQQQQGWQHGLQQREQPDKAGAPAVRIARAAVCAGGLVKVTTGVQLERQRALGGVMCAECGRFLRGERGLRMHQQVAHGATYEASAAEARSACRALQVLSGTAGALPGVAAQPSSRAEAGKGGSPEGAGTVPSHAALTQAWAAEARAREARRAWLPPALEAARTNDVQALERCGAAAALAARDRFGATALHWAAGAGALGCVKWMVETAGVDAGEAQVGGRGCGVGRTAVHWAARNGHLDVARYLVEEHGATANAVTIDGTTPLHLAVWRGRLELVRWLVRDGGADLHATNDHGCNAAQWAAQTGDIRTIAWLHEEGLDLHLLNSNAHSLVYKAAVKGRARMCRWLLQTAGLAGVQLSADADGNTPAKMAGAEGYERLAAWLGEAEAAARAAPHLDGAALVDAADAIEGAWTAATEEEDSMPDARARCEGSDSDGSS